MINGITRNRTDKYNEYRQLYASKRSGGGVIDGDGVELQTFRDTTKLLTGSSVVLDIQPEWAGRVTDISQDITQITDKIAELKKLHKAHLMVGLDSVDDNHAVEILTGEITRMIGQANLKLKSLGKALKRGAGSDSQKAVQNAQSALAQHLQEIAHLFRESQQTYLTKLRNRTTKFQDNFSSPEILDFQDKGFTEDQQAVVQVAANDAAQRYREITEISKSIVELAEIVKDLAVLIVDQGTLVDRIDYNIEKTYEATEEAVNQIEQASKLQSKTRTKICLILLIVGILCGALIFLFRVIF
ncbi:t-SNARE family protein [Pelomyxa schiedti]|nr:t-SNARE family protein [Pelomyxa schiedti]